MLEMITLTDRARVVLTSDSAVKASAKDREEPRVIFLQNAKIVGDEKPHVFTVRLLNARERMQVAELANVSTAQALFTAAGMTIAKIEGPGIKANSSESVEDALLRFPAQVAYTIAGWITERSSLKPDPLDGKK